MCYQFPADMLMESWSAIETEELWTAAYDEVYCPTVCHKQRILAKYIFTLSCRSKKFAEQQNFLCACVVCTLLLTHFCDPILQHVHAVHAIKVGYPSVNPFPASVSSSFALSGVMDVRPYVNREAPQLDILAHLLSTSCVVEGNIATPYLACNAPVSASTTNKKVHDIAISTKIKHAMYNVGGLCYTS